MLIIFFASCGDREIYDTVTESDDPDFSPETTEIFIDQTAPDSIQECFYLNNAAKLTFKSNYDTIIWYKLNNATFLKLAQEKSIVIAESGFYVAKIKLGNSIKYKKVGMYLCPCQVDNIPDAFSPNNDGVFDTWAPTATGVRSALFTIYNMNNSKLYESNDLNKGWDGVYDGKNAPSGTYKYEVKISLKSGKLFQYKGKLTLKR